MNQIPAYMCGEHGHFEEETGEQCPLCDKQMHRYDKAVFFDGAGWNGKVSRYCIVGKHTNVFSTSKQYTNNEMEYIGAIEAAMLAEENAVIIGDSQLVVNQVNGSWNCNEARLMHARDVLRHFCKSKNLTFIWVAREHNKAGQVLENSK